MSTTQQQQQATQTPVMPGALAPTFDHARDGWAALQQQERAMVRARGRAALAKVGVGAYLLSLDDRHGGAERANEEFRVEMAEALGDKFTWKKAWASQARNLARGAGALAVKGVDVTGDADALAAVSTLASNVGADGIAESADRIADAMAQGEADVVKAIRAESKRVRDAQQAPQSSATVDALSAAIEALDALTSDDAPELSADERAALAPLVKRLGALATAAGRALK